MIEVKRVEIRDRATLIPAIALHITSRGGGGLPDRLLQRAGFGEDPLVLLIHLEGQKCQWDAFEWGTSTRTMHSAHRWLEEHWEEHQDGGVVDVEFILGETKTPKMSEVA